jgi:hypothetical protein
MLKDPKNLLVIPRRVGRIKGSTGVECFRYLRSGLPFLHEQAEDFANARNFLGWTMDQNYSIRGEAFPIPNPENLYRDAFAAYQHSPESKAGRSSISESERSNTPRSSPNLSGEFTAILRGHASL